MNDRLGNVDALHKPTKPCHAARMPDASRPQDVLLTFLNGERSGVKEVSVALRPNEVALSGPGADTLRGVLEGRAGGLAQQTFHLEYDNTRLRECRALVGTSGDTLTLEFASQEPIDEF